MSSPKGLRSFGPNDGERTPALGPAGRRNSVATAVFDGPIQQSAPTAGRRNSVAASVFGGQSADERNGIPAARPLPECLDAQNRGKIYLMHDGEPQANPSAPGERSGKELWGKLRATLKDSTTRSWLGLTEKVDGSDESLVDKTEKKARSEAVLAGMYLDDTRFRQMWDSAQIVLLVYIAVLVPFRIGFDQNAEPGDFFFLFDVGVDIYFIVDVYLSFNTTRHDSEGKLVWKKRDVRVGYLKGWFTIDLLGCLPLHYLPLLPGIEADSDAMKSNKSVRLLRLARLLKLLRLARINRLLARYEEQLFAFMSSIKMGKTVLVMVFIGHWMCCLWYYAGSQPQSPDELNSDGEVLEGWVLQNFGGVTNFNHTDVMTRYMTSAYYAYATMTTVGYGDISATTYFEKIAAMLSMIIGGFVFGQIVGTLSDLSAQANPLDRVKTKQLSKVVGILQGRTPPVKQRVVKEVRKYFALKYQYETAIDLKPYLFELPEALRNDVARELHYISKQGDRIDDQIDGLLQHVPFFCELDNTSMIMLCLRMKFWSLDIAVIEEDGTRKQDVISEGTYGNEMFVIAKGVCEVITSHGKYKDWPTYKEEHIVRTLEECGLTEGQAAAIKAIESVAQHVKALPEGWSDKDNLANGTWASCGIEHDQASKILEYGSQDSRFALTYNATALSADDQANIAQVVIAAHSELGQARAREPGECGHLWRLPKNPHTVEDTKTVNDRKAGVRANGWTPARQGHHAEALTTAQKRRLMDLKKQYPPSSTSPYLMGLPSCDVTGGGAAAQAEVTGVVKLGKLETGDFFGETAVLLPHSAKGIVRTRSVYGVYSDDMPNFREVHVFVLSNEDLKQLEIERPAIKHMLLPYRRQAMANAYCERFAGLAETVSRHGGAHLAATKEEKSDDEQESDSEEDEVDGSHLSSPTRIPEHSTDIGMVAVDPGSFAASTVSRREFEALSQKVDRMQTQLEKMNESVGNKLDELLQRPT